MFLISIFCTDFAFYLYKSSLLMGENNFRACLNFIKVFYTFFFLDKKERKNKDKT